MKKHRLRGFYVGNVLFWLIVMDGFKYLGAEHNIRACCKKIKQEIQRELNNLRRIAF